MRAKPGGEASDGTGEHVSEGEGQEHVLRKSHDEVDDQTEDNDEEVRPWSVQVQGLEAWRYPRTPILCAFPFRICGILQILYR